MRKIFSLVFFTTLFITSYSQVHVGLFGGVGHYQGDLTDAAFVGKLTRGAGGITLAYELNNRIMIRGGLSFAQIAGNDRYNSKENLRLRNLSFETNVLEASLVGEFYTFDFANKRWSPYVFAGLAAYRFNPYVLTTGNEKIYLRPLSTEGQGLSQYPDRKPYSLIQLALPFGGGIKYAINDRIRIGAEIGLRKLFTDYFDDVSKTYVDQSDLRLAKGDLAVAMAYREDELPNGNLAYPAKGAQRGGSDQKDWYYLTGLTVSFRLGDGGAFAGKGKRSNYGCPTVPL